MPDEVKETPATPASPSPETLEAAEIGELIKAAGYSKSDINVLTQSATSLASIRNLIENNPRGFLESLERANPEAAQKFHGELADEYVRRYKKDEPVPAGDDKTSDLMTEIKLLREKVNQSETREQQREQAGLMAQIKNLYEAKVDNTVGQLPDDLKLTKSEKAAFKSQLNQRLASDPQIVERCAKGNFVDVPKVFKSIVDEWTNDRKEAVEAAAKAREESKGRSFSEFLGGPNPLLSETEAAKLTEGDDWETNIQAFGKALERG